MKKDLPEIDFVIAWVDGNDPTWITEKELYSVSSGRADASEARYRDWDNLRYWFRGVEAYAPWVRKIHFVTWGHLPPWLNTNHPKLHIVRHSDYIPKRYLPTFNSHTIELNLHRIPDLARQFVYFNDDMFLTGPVTPDHFFRKGKPCDMFALDAIYFGQNGIGHINGNNMEIINQHFNRKKVLFDNFDKFFCLRYGIKRIIKTICLLPWPWFPGIYYQHLPVAYLKDTFETVWSLEEERLEQTCLCRFRENSNVNQWVMKYWQLCMGNFEPISFRDCCCFHLRENNYKTITLNLRHHHWRIICINDTNELVSYESAKKIINTFFHDFLFRKSIFETGGDYGAIS